jgi:transposase
MGRIPDEIRRHRLPGTEIKKVGGKYYIQKVTSRYDPVQKRPRKVVLEYIGTVAPEGIVPRRARLVSTAAHPYSLEFGATWTVGALTGDIREQLEAHIGADAGWVYAAALLRCVHPCAMRHLEHAYSASYLSVSLPGLRMSPQELSAAMKDLGIRRREIAAFMRTFIPGGDWLAIFDGTSMVCNSKNIHEAQRGYNSHGYHDPQINLMYALAHKADGIAPVFYKRYPGSVRDISALSDNNANKKQVV